MLRKFNSALVWFGALFLLTPNLTFAANLYFTPASGTYGASTVFSVGIYVESADQAMNAVQGMVRFPVDKLQVVSLGQTGSIVDLWVQDPKFSNTEGSITFEGVALNPGFRGPSGKILTITFRPRSTGDAELHFQGGQILANDGKGTSILENLGTAQYAIIAGTQKPEVRTPVEGLEPPHFTKISKTIESGDPLIIEGQTYSNIRVSLWLKSEIGKEESFIVRSDADGKFTFVLDRRLNDGLYELWGEAIDSKDRKSPPSPRETLVVEPPAFLRVGTQVLNYLSLIIMIFVLLVLLLLASIISIRRYSALRKRIKKESSEAENMVMRQFYKLEESIKDHIKFLEETRGERELTREEEHALSALKKDLAAARDAIQKEVGDITEEVT